MTDRQPIGLRTAYAEEPLGLDTDHPRLSWTLDGSERGAGQDAFRVLVASDPETLREDRGDVWDTGKRPSGSASVVYDGPELESGDRYHWKVRVWENGTASAWSEPTAFGRGMKNDDWDAAWVRRPETEFTRGQFSYLRRAFDLDAEVTDARAYLSACHQYALSVNGERVDRGQSYAYPDAGYYKAVDLTDHLRAGENVVGALHNWNGEGQGRPAGEPGLLLQLDVTLADGSERTITTDGEWTWREAEFDEDADIRNGEIVEPVEVIDGRDVPEGWSEPGTDDEWNPVEVVGSHPTEPWTDLRCQPREVVREDREPVSLEEVEDGVYVADFGRVYAAEPVVEFADGENGHRVEMHTGYLLDEDGFVEEEEGNQWTDTRFAYVQPDGESTFEAYNYLGFRYLQLENPDEELSPEQVRIRARRNGVPDADAATLDVEGESPEGIGTRPALSPAASESYAAGGAPNAESVAVEDVWELARHSLLYGAQEQFIDTPTREKGQFLMDAFNMSWATTRAFGERKLSQQALREFLDSHYRYWSAEGRFNAVYPNGDGKRDIPDFTANFADWLWRYYEVSGDRELLAEAYPATKAAADYLARHIDEESGLITHLSGGVGGPYFEGIVDWPPEMRYGYDRDWEARTTVNALAANAFARTAEIAETLDRPRNEVAEYRQRHEALVEAIDEHFVNDEGLYVDGADGEGNQSEHASQHANAFLLAFGLVPEERVDRVADYVADQGIRMGPMMVIRLLQALDGANREDAIVEALTDTGQDGWAAILDAGGSFTWETWHALDPELDTDERHNRSQSHAMGATVLVAIQEALLGVSVTDDEAVEIAPPTGGIDGAAGTVPTERGEVAVEWSRSGGLTLDATVPWNTAATVVLPDAADAAVTESGTELEAGDETLPEGVRSVAAEDGDLRVNVESGAYAFAVEE